jgi:hypothetical protein
VLEVIEFKTGKADNIHNHPGGIAEPANKTKHSYRHTKGIGFLRKLFQCRWVDKKIEIELNKRSGNSYFM